MSEMDKINIDALEEVTGGVMRTVQNDAANYANVRRAPGIDAIIIAKVYNGTKLQTRATRTFKKDGYVWYEVTLPDGSDKGWIAGSLIGY
ncbi:MAG: SH3 domain-containing protein [Lachnospiraceae bacterium]|nr:SH3 domain-containing protein [Lachnospiraceae bacterium]